MKRILFLACALAGMQGPAQGAGTSLVDVQHYQSLYGDQRGVGEGDVVTVLVVESATAESQALSSGDRSFDLSGSLIKDDDIPKAGLSVDHTVSGQGRTTRSGAIRAQISTRVERVLATGNLLLRGVQSITINGEEQKLSVEGEVRQWDINADNAVLSSRLLNAKIDFIGQGWVTDGQRPGLLERIARFLGL